MGSVFGWFGRMAGGVKGLAGRGLARFKLSGAKAAAGPDVNVVLGVTIVGFLIGFGVVLVYEPPPGTTVAVVIVSGLGATILALGGSLLRRL